jgi:hypothetical protein
LGTTEELVDFTTSGAYPQDTNDSNDTIAALASYFHMEPRHQCWKDPMPLNHTVAMLSTFPRLGGTSIGRSSVVEYSDLANYESVTIGDNSMLSGWRNPTNYTTPLQLPSNLGVQLLALNVSDGVELFVYMVFGIRDAIKAERQDLTFYDVPIESRHRTGITLQDLGFQTEATKTDSPWTAKMRPQVPAGTSFESVFAWLFELQNPEIESLASNDGL